MFLCAYAAGACTWARSRGDQPRAVETEAPRNQSSPLRRVFLLIGIGMIGVALVSKSPWRDYVPAPSATR
jgi:hypothetical protein